eukprot:622424-Amphidinium_carterae.2
MRHRGDERGYKREHSQDTAKISMTLEEHKSRKEELHGQSAQFSTTRAPSTTSTMRHQLTTFTTTTSSMDTQSVGQKHHNVMKSDRRTTGTTEAEPADSHPDLAITDRLGMAFTVTRLPPQLVGYWLLAAVTCNKKTGTNVTQQPRTELGNHQQQQ